MHNGVSIGAQGEGEGITKVNCFEIRQYRFMMICVSGSPFRYSVWVPFGGYHSLGTIMWVPLGGYHEDVC